MSERFKQGLTELSHDVQVVDLRGRVLKGSRRITMRNRAFGSLAVVAVLTGAVITVNAIRPQPPTPPTNSPSPTVSPSPETSPSTPPAQPIGDVRNATFQVPAFPGDSSTCPAGERAFKDGKAQIDVDVKLTIDERAPVVGDLDGVPGSEVLINIRCDESTRTRAQVLALRADQAGRFQPIGFVLPMGLLLDIYDEVRVAERVISVPVLGMANSALDRQVRGYALRGKGFEQVSGPTTFPPLVVDVRAIDWRSATFYLSFQHQGRLFTGHAKVSGGAGEATLGLHEIPTGTNWPPKWLGTARFTVTVDGSALVKNAASWNPHGSAGLLVTVRDSAGGTEQGVYVFERHPDDSGSPAAFGLTLLQTGKDGVIAIEKIEGAGDLLKVTVMTGTGRKTWSYKDVQGESWKRAG